MRCKVWLNEVLVCGLFGVHLFGWNADTLSAQQVLVCRKKMKFTITWHAHNTHEVSPPAFTTNYSQQTSSHTHTKKANLKLESWPRRWYCSHFCREHDRPTFAPIVCAFILNASCEPITKSVIEIMCFGWHFFFFIYLLAHSIVAMLRYSVVCACMLQKFRLQRFSFHSRIVAIIILTTKL